MHVIMLYDESSLPVTMVRVVAVLGLAATLTLSHAVFVSNLDLACLKCICHASTGCDETFGCSAQGNCGPFFISRKYWEDAGSLSVDPNYPDKTHHACTRDINCASKVVADFMTKFGRDCNNDGVTDCDDYSRIHFFGPQRCAQPMVRTAYYERYLTCRPPAPAEDLSL